MQLPRVPQTPPPVELATHPTPSTCCSFLVFSFFCDGLGGGVVIADCAACCPTVDHAITPERALYPRCWQIVGSVHGDFDVGEQIGK